MKKQKKCNICKKEQTIENFYLDNRGYYLCDCKKCHIKKNMEFFIKKYGTTNRRKIPKLVDKVRETDKNYQKTKRLLKKEEKRLEVKNYYKKYPERIKATQIIYRAIKEGIIKRGKCRDCDRLDVQGHHPDYFKPLKVIWLCPIHHKLEDLKKVVILSRLCEKNLYKRYEKEKNV